MMEEALHILVHFGAFSDHVRPELRFVIKTYADLLRHQASAVGAQREATLLTIAERFGISESSVSRICAGNRRALTS